MWTYNNKNIEDTDIPTAAWGFIYLITNTANGKKYVGKKLLTMASTKKVNGKTKKCRKESAWKNYFGSCKELTADLKTHGKDVFLREILCFCNTPGHLAYMEAKHQFSLGVLESDDFYNSNINSKVFKSWFHGKGFQF